MTDHEPHGEDRSAAAAGPVPRQSAAAPSEPVADADTDSGLSFLDHLEDLRSVIIHSLIAMGVGAAVCWFWSAPLLDILVRPLAGKGVYFTAPNEAFMIRIKLAGTAGLFLVLPFILWKIYGFVLPGLYDRERKVVTPLLLATTVLFYTGAVFSFLVVSPAVVTFLLSFGTAIMEPLISIGPYFAFVSRLSFAFGLVFELPVLVFFLSMIGVVDPRMLLRTWRYALVVIATLSAVLTPPDVFSQLAMAVPVSLLYIISVIVALVVTRRRRAAAAAEAEAAAATEVERETETEA
ncbi:MAG: twin-arginine translocase subunit TatC [Candidatus Krumholzibacteriia bacterium]